MPAVEIAADQHVGLAHAAMPGAEAQALEAVVLVHKLHAEMAALGIQAASNAGHVVASHPPRHSGLDPGSIFLVPRWKEGGCRIKSGMTRQGETVKNHAMRPDILNPLFAEVEVLKGIGPALAKPLHRLEARPRRRHPLPSAGELDRPQARSRRSTRPMSGGRSRSTLTARDYRQSGGRGPFRIFAEDRPGNYVTLTYFNNPGWGKKQLPLGEARIVSGQARPLRAGIADGPSGPCAAPGRGRPRSRSASRSIRSPKGSPTTGSATSPGRRWRGGRSSANGSSPASRRKQGWPDWAEALETAHRDPAAAEGARAARL